MSNTKYFAFLFIYVKYIMFKRMEKYIKEAKMYCYRHQVLFLGVINT